jgi:hypothetical protein
VFFENDQTVTADVRADATRVFESRREEILDVVENECPVDAIWAVLDDGSVVGGGDRATS